jgi:hypothetical protein
MGLHNTAHYLKSKGRNDDTELVHMTKGEVHALKGLAAKHGGQLTINPETGLPEAGFLSNILPTVAGIAVGVATENPYLGMAVAGMGKYAQSGSITQGLMAGISAYGGSSLGASLAEAGAEAGTEAAVKAGNEAITKAAMETNIPTQAMDASRGMIEPQAINNITEATNALKTGAITPEQYSQLASQYSAGYAPVANASNTTMAGLKAVTASPGALGKFAMNNLSSIGMFGAPLLAEGLSNKAGIPTASTANTNPFGMRTIPTDENGKPIFNATVPAQPKPAYVAKYPNYVQTPYNPYAPVGTPTPTYEVHAADGGLMQNGPDKTDFMGTGAYPMSQQVTPHYATPSQMPTSAQAAMASYEPNTNPLTGEVTQLASGGIASYSGKYGSVVATSDAMKDLQDLYGPRAAMSMPRPDVGIYQDTDPNTRNLDAYSASLYKLNQKAKAAGMKKGSTDALKPIVKLGDIEEDAEGGVVGMAEGGKTNSMPTGSGGTADPAALVRLSQSNNPLVQGLANAVQAPSHIYQPSYANYQLAPYTPQATMTPEQLQAASAAYMQQGIPTPTRGVAQGSTGYAIDPKGMVGSPAYVAEQARIAEEARLAAEAAAANTPTSYDGGNGAAGGLMPQDLHYAMGGFVPSLGSYAAGGNPRLLKGPGDGMSDSIPANIGGKQPARLADGEFVVPADVVSHLGNGSTDAGAKRLYAMMDNIRKARTGRKRQAPAVKAEKYLPK